MSDTKQEPRTHRHVWVLILSVVLYPVFALFGLRSMRMLTFSDSMSEGNLVLPWLYFLFVCFIAFVGLRVKWRNLVWFTSLMVVWVYLLQYIIYEMMKYA